MSLTTQAVKKNNSSTATPTRAGNAIRTAQSASKGKPLDSQTRKFMESRFGENFDNVRIHDDSASDLTANSLGALAFTSGRDIYFAQGLYNPKSSEGKKILGHELTHVIQQKGSSSNNAQPSIIPNQSSTLEREADTAGQLISQGNNPSVYGMTSHSIQMMEDPQVVTLPAPELEQNVIQTQNQASSSEQTTENTSNLRNDGLTLRLAGYSIHIPSRIFSRLIRSTTAEAGTVTVRLDRVVEEMRPLMRALRLRNPRLIVNFDENFKFQSASLIGEFRHRLIRDNGTITGTVNNEGNISGTISATINTDRFKALQEASITGRITPNSISIDTNVGLAISEQISGNFHLVFLHDAEREQPSIEGSATGTYEGEKFSGEITLNYNEGAITGTGELEMELFSGFKIRANAMLDADANISIELIGEYDEPVELFDEWTRHVNFFDFERQFPLWGLYLPIIGTIGIVAEITANAGFRAKFGPGVLRGISISGGFSTDPEEVTTLGITGELFIPAGAEIVVSVGGGIGLSAAIASLTGGLTISGVAGVYGALTANTTLGYDGSNYFIEGNASLRGAAQLKAGINAYAKISVNLLFSRKTLWEKRWVLGEWHAPLNLAASMDAGFRANMGQPPSVSFDFNRNSFDPQSLISQAMPESGQPVRAPKQPPTPTNASLTINGQEGQVGPNKSAETSAPRVGSPPMQTQESETIHSESSEQSMLDSANTDTSLPNRPISMDIPGIERNEAQAWEAYQYEMIVSRRSANNLQSSSSSDSSQPRRQNTISSMYSDLLAYDNTLMNRNEFSNVFANHFFGSPKEKRPDLIKTPWRKNAVTIEANNPLKLPAAKQEGWIKSRYVSAASSNSLIAEKNKKRNTGQRRKWLAAHPIPSQNGKEVRLASDDSQKYLPTGQHWQVDHILEYQLNGADDLPNYMLLTSSANASSGSRIKNQKNAIFQEAEEYGFKNARKVRFISVENGEGIKGYNMSRTRVERWRQLYG